MPYSEERAKWTARKGTRSATHGLDLNQPPFNATKPRQPAAPQKPRNSALTPVVRAGLVGLCIIIAGGFYAHLASTSGFVGMSAMEMDHVPDSERLRRQQEFAARPPLPLQLVPAARVSAAIDGMLLSDADRQAVLSAALPTRDPSATPIEHYVPKEAPAPQQTPRPVRLAWITLWDTDVQDGDVVRIDSAGYSRTVSLTKGGETFAIPVPADGIVRVTGVKDGDGGGITVGLGSGGARAVFPIMSPGQTLALRVTID